MITAADPFVSPPRISRNQFIGIMAAVGSPWASKAGTYYDLIEQNGQDPSVWLAIGSREHGLGSNRSSVLWRNDTRSWTNARTVRDPDLTAWAIVHDPIRDSDYVRYASVEDSLRDGMYRVRDPDYRYVREGRTTIGQVLAIWTESEAADYIADVLENMNRWQERDGAMIDRAHADHPGVPFVPADSRHYTVGRTVDWPDLLACHHTDGWDSLGWLSTSPDSDVSATYLLNHDGTIRAQLVWHKDTPHTTADFNPRTISFEWERKWPEQRGVSDVQYRNYARSLAEAVLIERKRGNPHFQTTPTRDQVKSHRELYPGATECPGDLDMDRLHAELAMILATVDGTKRPSDADLDALARDAVKHSNGLWVPKVFVKRAGDLAVDPLHAFGYPITPAYIDARGMLVQWFERALFEYHPEAAGSEWEVQLALIGTELYTLMRKAVAAASPG